MADTLQTTLWAADDPESGSVFGALTPSADGATGTAWYEHHDLGSGAWVDIYRSWMRGGYDLLASLVSSSSWRSERRRMYDAVVDVPRLLNYFGPAAAVPWPELVTARQLLSDHYQSVLGEPFVSTGLCLYRDGNDSVAWHGDTIGRGATTDTVVAILSLGASRTFALRPKGGGAKTIRLQLDHGDLIAMGGSCQRTWDHAIPKTSRPVGVRVSVQFRVDGVQ